MTTVDKLVDALTDFISTKINYEFGVGSVRNTAEVREKLVTELAGLFFLIQTAHNLATVAGHTASQALLPQKLIGPGSDWYGQGQTTVINTTNFNTEGHREITDV